MFGSKKCALRQKKIEEITTDYHEWLIESLKDKEEAAAYLQVAIEEYQEDDNMETLLLALRNVAEAEGGIGKLSRRTHLNRESLYKTLSAKGNPRLHTIWTVLKGLGFQLSIQPAK